MRASLRLPLACLALALPSTVASVARAHVGAVIAKAVFYQPAPATEVPVPGPDGGIAWSYTPAEADAHYTLAWQDGDTDPTGRFAFFYLPYLAPIAVTAQDLDGFDNMGNPTGVAALGTPVVDVYGRTAQSLWTSCACAFPDASGAIADGSVCVADGGSPRWCDNEIEWDTSRIPDGVYWLYVVNTDPPYHAYNTSEVPVRVSHGIKKPPVVIVIRPDGFGLPADRSYQGAVLVRGDGPLTLDLAWGINDASHWKEPLHGFASALPAVAGADGLVTFDWDTSALASNSYFVSALVTDASGLKTYSDSRPGLSVFHKPDGSAGLDAAGGDLWASEDALYLPPIETPKGCSCDMGARRRAPVSEALFALAGLALALTLRARRAGSRSGCTGSRT